MTPGTQEDARNAAWRWPAALSVLWIACGAIYLTLPPSPDQFELGYLGWQMLEGAVPYRDFIDMNWPGVFWLHALASALFGNQLWSWRALDFMALGASAWFLQDLLRRTAGRTAAVVSLALYPLFYISVGSWFSGQSDMTAGQLSLVALWFHVRAHGRHDGRWQIGTGVLLALAMLNKPTLGVLGPLLLAHAAAAGIPLRRALMHTAVAAASAVGVLSLALLAVLAQGASLGEVLDATYTYNVWTQYLEAATPADLARTWWQFHVRNWLILSAAAAAGAGWLLSRAWRDPGATALAALWLAGVLSFLVQHRGFGYHLAPCFIPVVGLAAAAIGVCLDTGRAKGLRSWTSVVGIALALLVAGSGLKKVQTAYPNLAAAALERNYLLHLAGFAEGDGLTVADAVSLARQIERAVPAGETVLVLGTASSMNFLARRAQPTRFYYAPVLVNTRPPLPMAERWIDLFEGDLKRNRPRWCLIGAWARTQWLEGDSRGARALRDLLATEYRRIGVVGSGRSLELYERLR
jgi:4-amino-4-deoxy-L-arabinose transferase-like glycosyltransferase